jgi:hypothetical protein
MTVWWKVDLRAIKIKPVKKRRVAKGDDYFSTFEEAHNFLLDRFALNKFAAEALVLRCQYNLDKAAELKEPKS